jgi:hypothetical protein
LWQMSSAATVLYCITISPHNHRTYSHANLQYCVSTAALHEFARPCGQRRKPFRMSYEEYSNYREKMRLHMDKMHPQDPKQAPAPSSPTPEQTDKLNPNSAYGQGYHSRERTEDRPDAASGSRPEHPRGDRFDRGGMGRR